MAVTTRIEHGDTLDVIPRLVDEGVVVDSIVTDPPYHLQARTKRFGKEGSAPPQHGRDGAMGRLSRGFMGQEWDGGDIAFRPETWATIGTILRPGGFMLVFGGPRTYHRMVCAIEDAGFIIQDCILWLYGTGFPKRRDALKPAYEPICVAYKPGGARTLQVDECRIAGLVPNTTRGNSFGRMNDDGWQESVTTFTASSFGRWPANICHDGSDEVVSMFPNSKGQQATVTGKEPSTTTRNIFGLYGERAAAVPRHDAGSAARFFWSPKANKTDRAGSSHPTIKPITLMKWLVPLVTPVGGTVLDPFAGSGTTGQAAHETGREYILIEREWKYVDDIRRRLDVPDLEHSFRDLTVALRGYVDAL